MASWKTVLTFTRLLALVGTVVMLALGIWCKYELSVCFKRVLIDDYLAIVIVRNIEDRGSVVLESFRSRLGSDTVLWSHFVTEAAKGAVRVSVLVAMVSSTPTWSVQSDGQRVRSLLSRLS
jgi:hypothetical protein